MAYIFTVGDVETLQKTVPSAVKQKITQTIVPQITAECFSDMSSVEKQDMGDVVGWILMSGKDAVRMMPQYFMKSFGFDEIRAHTLADRILDRCGAAIAPILDGINIDALRVPWKAKVDSAALKNADQPVSKPTIAPVSVAPEPEVIAFEQKGLRHQDAGDRLAIRVRMIEQLAGIKFNNNNLEERFRHVIRPALKGIKELDDVRQQLALTEDRGGVGMGQNQVDEVVGLIERLHAKDLELAARATVAKPVAPKSMLPMVEDEKTMLPVIRPDGIASSPWAPRNDKKGAPRNDRLDTLIQQSAADQPMDFQRKMHDVIARPISMGPIEELRTMRLIDFRRLASKPAAAVDKLRQRLELLRDEGVDRYAAGITAWRESSIYGVYVAMIKQGLIEGRPVEDIAAGDTSDLERLSGEELQAVIELNKSLRF